MKVVLKEAIAINTNSSIISVIALDKESIREIEM